jgi:hypothetical protein
MLRVTEEPTMKALLILLALTLAAFCGGCGDYNRVNQSISLDEAVASELHHNTVQAATLQARVDTTGEHHWNGKDWEMLGRDDNAAAVLFAEIQTDQTPTSRALRGKLAGNVARREQPSVPLAEGMAREMMLSEGRFAAHPGDVLEYLTWSALALKLKDDASVERTAERAALAPCMIDTIRKDRFTLDTIVRNLRARQRDDLAERIDWPQKVKGNAEHAETFQNGLNGIGAVATHPMLPVWILFGAKF